MALLHRSKPEPQLQLEPEPQPKHFSFGPSRGVGGDSWDETFWTIRRFVVYHGLWIDSIQIEYEDENGMIMLSKKHGRNGGSRSEVNPNPPLNCCAHTLFIEILSLSVFCIEIAGCIGISK